MKRSLVASFLFFLCGLVGAQAQAISMEVPPARVLVYEEAGINFWYEGGGIPSEAGRVLSLRPRDVAWIKKTFAKPQPGSVVHSSQSAFVRGFLAELKKNGSATVLFRNVQDAAHSFAVELVVASADKKKQTKARLTDVIIRIGDEKAPVYVCEFVKTCVLQKQNWGPVVALGALVVGCGAFAFKETIKDMARRWSAVLEDASCRELNALLGSGRISQAEYHQLIKQRREWMLSMDLQERSRRYAADKSFKHDYDRFKVEEEDEWRTHATTEQLAAALASGRLTQAQYDHEIDARTKPEHPMTLVSERRKIVRNMSHGEGVHDAVWQCAEALREHYRSNSRVYVADTRVYADNLPCVVNALSHSPCNPGDKKVLVIGFGDLSKRYIRKEEVSEGSTTKIITPKISIVTVASILGEQFKELKERGWVLVFVEDGHADDEARVLRETLGVVLGDPAVFCLDHAFTRGDLAALAAFVDGARGAISSRQAECVISADCDDRFVMIGGNCLCGDVVCRACLDASLSQDLACPLCRAYGVRPVQFRKN